MIEEVFKLMAFSNNRLFLQVHSHQPFFDVIPLRQINQSVYLSSFGYDKGNAKPIIGWREGIECGFEQRSGGSTDSDSFKIFLPKTSIVVVIVVFFVPVQSAGLHLFVNFHNSHQIRLNSNSKGKGGLWQARRAYLICWERGACVDVIQSWSQLQQKCQSLKMSKQQLPKATMNSFIKHHLSLNGNPDFVAELLHVSKEFITRLADRSNKICETNSKKTINAEHLQAALEQFGLSHHTTQLKRLGNQIKQTNVLKREASKKLQEIIERERREERERRLTEEPEKKEVTVREEFNELKIEESKEEDYENMEAQEISD